MRFETIRHTGCQHTTHLVDGKPVQPDQYDDLRELCGPYTNHRVEPAGRSSHRNCERVRETYDAAPIEADAARTRG